MISSLIFGIAVAGGSEASASPAWHVSYAAAMAEVTQADKPLFILFDRGPSGVVRLVGGSPVMHEDVTRALSAHYVRMYVDTTEAGKSLAARFGASELPLAVVVDRTGTRQMYRRPGVPSSTELVGALTEYRRVKYTGSNTATRAPQWAESSARNPVRVETRSYPPTKPDWSSAWCRT